MSKTPLQKCRELTMLTQEEVAGRVEIHQSHYNRIERGKAGWGCSAAVAERIVKVFKRFGLEEQHVLYPRRHRNFRPTAT
jgi:DNA-binding XRE family transcriptional regulator